MRIRMVWLAALLLFLSGCTARSVVWETVDDEVPLEAASWLEGAKVLSFAVPADAAEQAQEERPGLAVYEQTDRDYEITSEVLLASDLGSAVRRVSGFDADQLEILKTSRCGREEYLFAWYAGGDEGGRLCRASLMPDGLRWYAVTFRVREGLGTLYDNTAKLVFSSITLSEPGEV